MEDRYMDPAFSEYEKRAYYAVFPELADYFQEGENCLAIQVATGWRAPENVCYKLTGMIPAYVGETQLSAVLRLIQIRAGATNTVPFAAAIFSTERFTMHPIRCGIGDV